MLFTSSDSAASPNVSAVNPLLELSDSCATHECSSDAEVLNHVSTDYSFEPRKFHIRKGKCVIFNHKSFHPIAEQGYRYGTDKDAADLERVFRRLNFVVDLYNDKTRDEIKTLMDNCKIYL